MGSPSPKSFYLSSGPESDGHKRHVCLGLRQRQRRGAAIRRLALHLWKEGRFGGRKRLGGKDLALLVPELSKVIKVAPLQIFLWRGEQREGELGIRWC